MELGPWLGRAARRARGACRARAGFAPGAAVCAGGEAERLLLGLLHQVNRVFSCCHACGAVDGQPCRLGGFFHDADGATRILDDLEPLLLGLLHRVN